MLLHDAFSILRKTHDLFLECQASGLMDKNDRGELRNQSKKAKKKLLGLTKEPLFRDVYDPHWCLPPLHYLLCELSFIEQLLYHFNARKSFPNDYPLMGIGVGLSKTKDQMKAVNDAKHRVIDKAKLTMGILLDSPDSGGTAGNTGMY